VADGNVDVALPCAAKGVWATASRRYQSQSSNGARFHRVGRGGMQSPIIGDAGNDQRVVAPQSGWIQIGRDRDPVIGLGARPLAHDAAVAADETSAAVERRGERFEMPRSAQ